jgi:cytoskeletal protein RodZ
MTFLHKSVGDEPSSFGSDLRDLRELHAITLETACKETKIDRSVLEAFESDSIEDIDDPIFSERHLLAYVKYLGGYEPYFKARYQTRLKELGKSRKTEDLLPRKRKVRFLDLFVAPQFLAFLGVILLAVGLGSYVLWQAYTVNTAPPLEIETPIDGERLDGSRVLVKGQTIPEAYVLVNDRDAAVESDGSFHLELDVPRGTTIISIIARRRRGSETRIERRVIFDREVMEIPSTEELFATSTEATTSTEEIIATSTEE